MKRPIKQNERLIDSYDYPPYFNGNDKDFWKVDLEIIDKSEF